MTDVAVITLSENGQVVLPKRTRDKWQLKKGDQLILIEENERMVLTKVSHMIRTDVRGESLQNAIASEKVLAKDWNFSGDDVWDEL